VKLEYTPGQGFNMGSSPAHSRKFSAFFRKWWLSLVIAGFAFLTLYVVFGKEGGIVKLLDMKDENELLHCELVQLQDNKEELEDQIQRLNDKDTTLIEEEARRQGMVKKGEIVYNIRYQDIPDSIKQPDMQSSSRENQ